MHPLKPLVLILTCSSLIACQGMTNQDAGIITGSVAGGILGSTIGKGGGQMMAIMGGAIAGAFVGNAVGKHMDRQDLMMMNRALENNAVGAPAYWRNANTGASYEVVPVRDFSRPGERYCREYRTVANIGGKQQQIYGKACRQPDGTWRVN